MILSLILFLSFFQLSTWANQPCAYSEVSQGKKVCYVFQKPGDFDHFYFFLPVKFAALAGEKKYKYFRVDYSQTQMLSARLNFERIKKEDYIELRTKLKIPYIKLLEIYMINLEYYEEVVRFTANYTKLRHLKVYLKGNKKRRKKTLIKVLGKNRALRYLAWEQKNPRAKQIYQKLYGKN